MSTVRTPFHDKTVVLKKSDYAGFVDQQYYVAYVHARFEKVDDILNRNGYAVEAKPFNPEIFQKVFDGMFAPRGATSQDVREYCSRRVSATPGKVRNLAEEEARNLQSQLDDA